MKKKRTKTGKYRAMLERIVAIVEKSPGTIDFRDGNTTGLHIDNPQALFQVFDRFDKVKREK